MEEIHEEIKEAIKALETYKNRYRTMDTQDVIDMLKRLNENVKLTIPVVSFELPSDEIFDMPEVNLNNPLEEFYYYERPPYLKSEQKDFKERLQKALNYLKGN